MGRFEKQAREKHPDATDEQIVRVARHLKSAYFQRLALASAKARRAASGPDADGDGPAARPPA